MTFADNSSHAVLVVSIKEDIFTSQLHDMSVYIVNLTGSSDKNFTLVSCEKIGCCWLNAVLTRTSSSRYNNVVAVTEG